MTEVIQMATRIYSTGWNTKNEDTLYHAKIRQELASRTEVLGQTKEHTVAAAIAKGKIPLPGISLSFAIIFGERYENFSKHVSNF